MPDGYNFNLPEIPEAKHVVPPNTVQLNICAKGYAYYVLGLDGKTTQKGIIPWDRLPSDTPRKREEILPNKAKLLPKILAFTTNEGHTPALTNETPDASRLALLGRYFSEILVTLEALPLNLFGEGWLTLFPRPEVESRLTKSILAGKPGPFCLRIPIAAPSQGIVISYVQDDKGYSLSLKSAGWSGGNTIALEIVEHGYGYQVFTVDKFGSLMSLETGFMPRTHLPHDAPTREEDILSNKQRLLPWVLIYASKKGHITSIYHHLTLDVGILMERYTAMGQKNIANIPKVVLDCYGSDCPKSGMRGILASNMQTWLQDVEKVSILEQIITSSAALSEAAAIGAHVQKQAESRYAIRKSEPSVKKAVVKPKPKAAAVATSIASTTLSSSSSSSLTRPIVTTTTRPASTTSDSKEVAASSTTTSTTVSVSQATPASTSTAAPAKSESKEVAMAVTSTTALVPMSTTSAASSSSSSSTSTRMITTAVAPIATTTSSVSTSSTTGTIESKERAETTTTTAVSVPVSTITAPVDVKSLDVLIRQFLQKECKDKEVQSKDCSFPTKIIFTAEKDHCVALFAIGKGLGKRLCAKYKMVEEEFFKFDHQGESSVNMRFPILCREIQEGSKYELIVDLEVCVHKINKTPLPAASVVTHALLQPMRGSASRTPQQPKTHQDERCSIM